MPEFTVKVKWGKEVYSDVIANTDDDPMLFKAQIFALTGVRPERQKVVVKGVTLKDNDWGNIKLANGAFVLVMGSKDEDVPQAPVEKTKFVEDMNEVELKTALDMPQGLVNLGNTCYMNAVVQCLRTVPELKHTLIHYSIPADSSISGIITTAMSDTMRVLERGTTAVGSAAAAAKLLSALHQAAPRFAERTTGGNLAQQDASECWGEFVRSLQQRLKADNGKPLIDQYFGGTFDVELVCTEAEEDPKKTQEEFLQLSCFISQDVKYLQSGLKSKLQEAITKMSPTLGRDAIYTKTAKISRLPAYLTIQFVRFFYKERESINAKILKDIKFPVDLDVFELCTPELQERLLPMRAKFKAVDDALAENKVDVKKPNQGDGKSEEGCKKTLPYCFEDDIGSNNSGLYRLQAVLTHRGRSSTSGHYVAWIRHKDGWMRCDDEVVSPVSEEEVLKLSGGGDWHCAYLLLYGPRILEMPEGDSTSAMEVASVKEATEAKSA